MTTRNPSYQPSTIRSGEVRDISNSQRAQLTVGCVEIFLNLTGLRNSGGKLENLPAIVTVLEAKCPGKLPSEREAALVKHLPQVIAQSRVG